jgi:hypothetical protein
MAVALRVHPEMIAGAVVRCGPVSYKNRSTESRAGGNWMCLCLERIVISVVGCCGLMSVPAFLAAQSGNDVFASDNTGREDARARFREGQILFAEERYAEAAARFRESYDLSPNFKLLYNIAQSDAAARQYDLALEAFEQYLVGGGDEIPPDRQAEVRGEIDRLRAMVGTLLIDTHRGAEVSVNGRLRGVAPIHGGIPITAGMPHLVTVKHDGRKLPEETVRVMGGQTVSLTVLEETGGPAVADEQQLRENPPSTSLDQTPGSGRIAAGVALLGVGGAFLVAGGITGGLALGKENELDDQCDGAVCDSQYQSLADARDQLGVASSVLFGVGGTAVLVGVVMTVAGKRRATADVSVVPVLSQRHAGVHLRWSW